MPRNNRQARRNKRRNAAILNAGEREGASMATMSTVRSDWGQLLGRAQTRERHRGDSCKDTMILEVIKLPCDLSVVRYRYWGFVTLEISKEMSNGINLEKFGLSYIPELGKWGALSNWVDSPDYIKFTLFLRNEEL